MNKNIIFSVLLLLMTGCISKNSNNAVSEGTHILDGSFRSPHSFVTMNPVMQVLNNRIQNKVEGHDIVRLPDFVHKDSLAYTFIKLSRKGSVFKDDLTVLIDGYKKAKTRIYIDKNGNLDFTDDGPAYEFLDSLVIHIESSEDKRAKQQYLLKKPSIADENKTGLLNKYGTQFKDAKLLSTDYWLTTKKQNLKVSVSHIKGNPITVLTYDASSDGVFSFDPGKRGDRIVLLEGDHSSDNDFLNYIQNAEPIDHNAIFELYGNKYYIKSLSLLGDTLKINRAPDDTRASYVEGKNISEIELSFLTNKTVKVKDLITDDKQLLIDVGGTWCGGCRAQEPDMKKLYKEGNLKIVGVFAYDTEESLKKYVKDFNIEWPAGLMNAEFEENLNIVSFPTYILVSRNGEIKYMVRTVNELKNYLNLQS